MAIYQNKDNPLDMRAFVNDRLIELGISKSELSRRIELRGVCNRETVMRYLRGTTETSADVLSNIFSELGLSVMAQSNV